jgi:hypothetical protein
MFLGENLQPIHGKNTQESIPEMSHTTLTPATFTTTIVKDFAPGHYEKFRQVTVAGRIVDKVTKKGFVMYKITDEDEEYILRVLCLAGGDVDSFDRVHSTVGIDDMILVSGHPGVSRRGNPVLQCNEFNPIETECSESEGSESQASSWASSTPGQMTVTFEEIPLTICRDNIVYQGRSVNIRCIDTTTPLQIMIDTEIGDFYITQMVPGKFVGIFVPPTSLEKEFKSGYDILIREDFENVIRALF